MMIIVVYVWPLRVLIFHSILSSSFFSVAIGGIGIYNCLLRQRDCPMNNDGFEDENYHLINPLEL